MGGALVLFSREIVHSTNGSRRCTAEAERKLKVTDQSKRQTGWDCCFACRDNVFGLWTAVCRFPALLLSYLRQTIKKQGTFLHTVITMAAVADKRRLNMYIVDAFAAKAFAGNPAAVCPLDFDTASCLYFTLSGI